MKEDKKAIYPYQWTPQNLGMQDNTIESHIEDKEGESTQEPSTEIAPKPPSNPIQKPTGKHPLSDTSEIPEFLQIASAALIALGHSAQAQFPDGFTLQSLEAFVLQHKLPQAAVVAIPRFLDGVVCGNIAGFDVYRETLRYLQFAYSHPEFEIKNPSRAKH